MVQPNIAPSVAEQGPAQATIEAAQAWLVENEWNWKTLIEAEGVELDPESPEGEAIYPLPENPFGTSDEVAVVIYSGLEEPHEHIGEETEAHVIAEGSALYVKGDKYVPLGAGGVPIILEPGTPHFAYATADKAFVAIVISAPNFNPENQVPLSRDEPRHIKTLDLYDKFVPAA